MEIKIEFPDNSAKLSDLEDFEIDLLKRTIELSKAAKDSGNHPFGCLLADAEGNILMEQGNEEVSLNGDCTAHAEALLMRKASQKYSKEQMGKLSLYSSCEPCAMCSGAIYWGNLGRLVYAAREAALKELTGDDIRNPTLDLPCGAVFARGQKEIEIVGPVLELEPEFIAIHRDYWQEEK